MEIQVERTAKRFCGLCVGGMDLLASQKRLIYCAADVRRDRPAIDRDPADFLADLTTYLPGLRYSEPKKRKPLNRRTINAQLPGCAMLQYPEVKAHLGPKALYYWFEVTVYAAYKFVPSYPPSLEPVLPFKFIFGTNEVNAKAVEILSTHLPEYWVATSPSDETREDFSAGVLNTLTEELLLPRLKIMFDDANLPLAPLAFPIAVKVTAFSDYRSHGSALMEPPV